MSVHVVAHFHALPGTGRHLEALLVPLVEPTVREDGCLTYRLHRDDDDEEHYVFVEEWRDQLSLEVHLGSLHVQAMLSAVEPLLTRPIDAFRLTAR